MPERIENEADLVRDIAFILPRVLGAVPKRRRDLYGDWAEMMARRIVDHLRLSNWRINKGPPAQPHSIGTNPPR